MPDVPPFQLSLEFSGMCAFLIPREELASEVTVLLLDPATTAADGGSAPGEPPAEHSGPGHDAPPGGPAHDVRHDPYLCVDTRAVATEPTDAADVSVTLPGGRAAMLWSLRGYDVTIDRPSWGEPSAPTGVELPASDLTAPRGSVEFWRGAREHLANLRKLAPNRCLNPLYLGSRPARPVVARVRLTSGRLCCLPPTLPAFRDNDAEFYFDQEEDPRYACAVTDRVCYELEAPSGEFAIELVPHADNRRARARRIVLTQVQAGTTEADVPNLEARVTIGALPRQVNVSTGVHFAHFLGLLGSTMSADLVVEPKGPGSLPGTPGTVFCPPSIF